MKLKDCRNNYDYFSGKASDIARYIAFAGFAIIWIFKTEFFVNTIPIELVGSALLLMVTIVLDLLQYIAGTLTWAIFNRIKEHQLKNDNGKEFTAPVYINYPTLLFFWSKFYFLIFAYIILSCFLSTRLNLF